MIRRILLGLVLLLPACGSDDGDLHLYGSVERTLVEVAAPTSEAIIEVAVHRGQHVAAGDPLLRLDPTLAEAEIARAQANLAGTQTAVIIANHELSRAQNLHGANVSSEQALERAQLDRSEAYARLREAEASVAVARKQRRDLDLQAPSAGVVDQIPFDLGERVPVGAVVAVLLDDSAPWVRVWIPEDRYVDVHPGTPARIEIDGLPDPLEGSVLDVSREPEFTPHYALTERDRTYLVYQARVEIHDAPPSLRPGVPAEVWLRAGAHAVSAP